MGRARGRGAGGILALLACGTALAQAVYVTPGEFGPVYSDKPRAGAKEVALPPLSIVPAPPQALPASPRVAGDRAAPSADAPGGDAPIARAGGGDGGLPYSGVIVLWPEDGGSVVANDGAFEVRVAVEPALRVEAGDAFVVKLNGRPLAQRFAQSEFVVPPESWGDAPPTPNQLVQLDVGIVDAAGELLRQASPVRFYLRHASRLNRPRAPATGGAPKRH